VERRLSRLQTIYSRAEQRHAAGNDRYDLSALSQDEILELDALLVEPACQELRTGTASYAMLTGEQLACLEQLCSRVKEVS
jgi:hypothetical protein